MSGWPASGDMRTSPLNARGVSRDPEISWERAAWLLILGWSLCSAAIVSLLPGLFGLG